MAEALATDRSTRFELDPLDGRLLGSTVAFAMVFPLTSISSLCSILIVPETWLLLVLPGSDLCPPADVAGKPGLGGRTGIDREAAHGASPSAETFLSLPGTPSKNASAIFALTTSACSCSLVIFPAVVGLGKGQLISASTVSGLFFCVFPNVVNKLMLGLLPAL
jgi:hypothetical protein